MYRFKEKFNGKVSSVRLISDYVSVDEVCPTDNEYVICSIFKDNINLFKLEKGDYLSAIYENIAFCVDGNAIINYDINLNEKDSLSEESESKIYSCDDEFFKTSLYKSKRTVFISNINNASVYLPTKVVINQENILENKVVTFYFGKNVWCLEFEDIHHHLSVLTDNLIGYRGFKNKNIIKVRNLHSGLLLWELNISELQIQYPIKYPVIKGFDPPKPQQENLHLELISHENLLIFSTSLARTFAFNIQTGELVWMKSNYSGELMIYGNHLIQFLSMALKAVVVDIFTGELIEEISYIEEFREISNKFRTSVFYRHIVHNDYICFIDDEWSIIFLNLKTKKIDWYTHFEHGGIRQYPVLQGDFMYILDGKNVLHIFEKTTDN